MIPLFPYAIPNQLLVETVYGNSSKAIWAIENSNPEFGNKLKTPLSGLKISCLFSQ